MKHVHYEMVLAKAANMDLVLFIKLGDQWQITGNHDNQVINIASHYDYFLCLPRHKESCLHWLNGGEVQFKRVGGAASGYSMVEFGDMDGENSREWSSGTIFLSIDHALHIKPNKEKRWIIVDPKTDYTFNGLYFSKEYAEEENGGEHQVIEIEVEV